VLYEDKEQIWEGELSFSELILILMHFPGSKLMVMW
jgi:hypothetical protein